MQETKPMIDILIILENGMLQDWFLELLNNVSFVLYLTALKTALIPKAHLVIPTQTHLEKKGTFTNKGVSHSRINSTDLVKKHYLV